MLTLQICFISVIISQTLHYLFIYFGKCTFYISDQWIAAQDNTYILKSLSLTPYQLCFVEIIYIEKSNSYATLCIPSDMDNLQNFPATSQQENYFCLLGLCIQMYAVQQYDTSVNI